MRSRSAVISLAAATLFLINVAASADPKDTVRRDPEGRKGISPYMELVVKGDGAFVAHDLPGATQAFQDAIKSDPSQMLGFYRLAEVETETGKLDDADKSLEAALNKRGSDDLKGKVLFKIADLRERQGKWQQAKDAWAAYAAYCEGHPKVKGFPDTALERMKKADRRMSLEADYAKVRERIQKRIAEKEQEAAENAKKDKLNR